MSGEGASVTQMSKSIEPPGWTASALCLVQIEENHANNLIYLNYYKESFIRELIICGSISQICHTISSFTKVIKVIF